MLRPYQHQIATHIINTPRCNVWSSMGSGKTLATLFAVDMLDLLEPVFPMLIIAPKRVIDTVWAQEASKWAITTHLRFDRLTGSAPNRTEALSRPADI